MQQIEMDIWERTPENPRILKYVVQRNGNNRAYRQNSLKVI